MLNFVDFTDEDTEAEDVIDTTVFIKWRVGNQSQSPDSESVALSLTPHQLNLRVVRLLLPLITQT